MMPMYLAVFSVTGILISSPPNARAHLRLVSLKCLRREKRKMTGQVQSRWWGLAPKERSVERT